MMKAYPMKGFGHQCSPPPLVGDGPGGGLGGELGVGCGPLDAIVSQSSLGSDNLALTEFNNGVERSDIISPLSSHIKNPFRLFSIAYSVLSQILLSLSNDTKPPAK